MIWLLSVLLTASFVTLKVLDKIDWSWWWVLSPLWMAFLAILVIWGIMISVALLVAGKVASERPELLRRYSTI